MNCGFFIKCLDTSSIKGDDRWPIEADTGEHSPEDHSPDKVAPADAEMFVSKLPNSANKLVSSWLTWASQMNIIL